MEIGLFRSVCLTKNANIDKYEYFRFGIGFDRKQFFSHPRDRTDRNRIVFDVDMSSSKKINNRKKDFLIIDKRATQGLEHTLSSEKMYSISFTKNNKTFCLRLHYNGANSYW